VVNVRAKAAHGIAGEAEVYGLFLLQLVVLPGIEKRQHQVADIVWSERRSNGGSQGSVHAQSDRRAGDQQQVGSVLPVGESQQPIDRAVALGRPRRQGLLGWA